MAGLSLAGRLALDANCLSYFVLRLDRERAEKMRVAVRQAQRWGLEVSALAISEVLVEPARHGPRQRFEDAAGAIENSPLITTVVTDGRIARVAAELRAERSLRLPDAIVVASAMATSADTLLSNDRQVVSVAKDYLRAVYFDDWEPD